MSQRIAPRAVPQANAPQEVKARAAATSTDALPAYIPQQRDPTLQGFLEGLSSVSPVIQQKLQEVKETEAGQATADAEAGVEPTSDSGNYTYHYMHTRGLVTGQQDANALWTSYHTEFDKDGGDLEGFLRDKYKAQMNGAKDGPYLQGYNKQVAGMLDNIRKEHLTFQRKTVETRVESDAMQLIDNFVGSFVKQDIPVPDDWMENLQGTGKKLGISDQRFQELVYETVKRKGDEGHFTAYDLLKKPRSDGSPGLYYDPAWKSQIDSAELHSFSVAEQAGRKDRDQRQNEALYPVFAEEDPKKAQQLFKELKSKGLFTRADDLIKWEKLVVEKVDGKPDIGQLEQEGSLLTKAYQGKLGYRDVLQAESEGKIVSGQRKYLLSEIRRVQTENRSLAAQEGKAEEAIYKTKEFGSAMDYVEGILKPRPRDVRDGGIAAQADLEFDHMQLAQARREFFTKSSGKTAAELQDLADEVASRYLKRRQAQGNGGMTNEQKERATQGKVPYASLQELRANVHLHSTDELRVLIQHFRDGTGR